MANDRLANGQHVQIERLDGEIDIACVPALKERFGTLTNDLETLIVDLSSVTFLDSSGIGFLHDLDHRLRVRSQRLVVVSPPGTPPRRVLDLTAFARRVTLIDSLAAART
jgi:stage II sporulation protein AA (anti-sigma F factor antagonist)